MLTIEGYGTGTCIWCRQESEGVQAEFRDGLTGFLCRKHFWQALRIRSDSSASRATGRPGSGPAKAPTPSSARGQGTAGERSDPRT
jgi:hypothetical protein